MIPASHGSTAPTARNEPSVAPLAMAPSITVAASAPAPVSPTRYVTPDGRLLDVVPGTSQPTPGPQLKIAEQQAPRTRAPSLQHNASHRKVAHHHTQQSFNTQHQDYAQNTFTAPVQPQPQPYYAPQPRPVQSYVSDMHPVGTGVGAVVGGLLGNQVGGGNGKKLATIAGVLMGGYAGNEVAHNRNPLP
ncbi:MAG: glycine zipper 2TM domain-containing protein [Herminiimonas sp.]|nr:glycine zipper 2TM domain-containing protein [Herminiimonas sp.]